MLYFIVSLHRENETKRNEMKEEKKIVTYKQLFQIICVTVTTFFSNRLLFNYNIYIYIDTCIALYPIFYSFILY